MHGCVVEHLAILQAHFLGGIVGPFFRDGKTELYTKFLEDKSQSLVYD